MGAGKLIVVGFVVVLLMQGSSINASAHERRQVADSYEFVVGPISEPLTSGQINGIDLRGSSQNFIDRCTATCVFGSFA